MNFKRTTGIMTFAMMMSISSSQANSLLAFDSSVLRDSSMKANFKVGAINQDSDVNKANLLSVQIGATYTNELKSNLTFKLNAAANLEKGNSDSFVGNNEYEASNGLSLKEATLTWKPFTNIELSAGAIGQGVVNNRQLVSNTSFLGARQAVQFKAYGFEYELSAMQSAPSNKNLSNRLDRVDEGSPVFFVETFKFGREVKGDGYFRSTTSHFAFDNLSNSVASESGFMGNTVNRQDNSNASFKNSYIGWAQTLEGEKNITSNLSVESVLTYVLNTAAKEDNAARALALQGNFYSNDQKYSLGYENFESQADASVAFYNSSRWGHANKKGHIVYGSYKDELNNLETSVGFIMSEEIKNNAYQADDNIIYFKLGKSYDLF